MMGIIRNLFQKQTGIRGKAWLYFLTMIQLQCSFEKPQIPQWDLPIQVPLFEKTYSVQELSQKSPNLFVDDQGLLGLQFSGQIDTTWVSNRLALESVDRTFNLRLGASEIDSVDSFSQSFLADDIWPGLLQSDEQELVLPPQAEILIRGTDMVERDFLTLALQSGQAQLTIENQLPIAFQTITIRLLARSSGAVILAFDFPDGIAGGQMLQKTLNLVDLLIPEEITWEVITGTPGSNGQTVRLKKSQCIKLTMELKKLVIDKIVAKFKPVSISQIETLTLPDDLTIDQARFGSGRVIVTGTNDSELDVSILAEFVEIHTQAQHPLQFQFSVLANSNSNRVIDLKGCTADLNLPMSGNSQRLSIRLHGSTYDTGEKYVTLEHQDLIRLEMRMEDLYFDRIQGCLAERQFSLPEATRSIQIPAGLEGISFTRGKLVLDLFSTIDMPIRIQGQVTAKNAARQISTLPYEVLNLTKNVTTQVIYTEKNSPILDLLNLLPNSLTNTGFAYVGDGITPGHISSTDFVCGDYRFESPAILSWNDSDVKIDTTVVYISPEDGSQDQNSGKHINGDLTRRLQRCSLDFTLRHSLPVAMQLLVKFSTQISHLVDQPELVIGPLELPAPMIENSGKPQSPMTNSFRMTLSEQELAIFKNSSDSLKTLYILSQALFAKSHGPVQFYASDSLCIRGQAELAILIDGK